MMLPPAVVVTLPAERVGDIVELSKITGALRDSAETEAAKTFTRIWVVRPQPAEPPEAYLLAWLVADEAQIVDLATAPSARRKGHARRLIAALVDHARLVQKACVVLEVRADNAPAQALYEACGFSVSRRRPRYYRDGTDALEMVLALSSS